MDKHDLTVSVVDLEGPSQMTKKRRPGGRLLQDVLGHREPRITQTCSKCWLESTAVIAETEKSQRNRFGNMTGSRIQVQEKMLCQPFVSSITVDYVRSKQVRKVFQLYRPVGNHTLRGKEKKRKREKEKKKKEEHHSHPSPC